MSNAVYVNLLTFLDKIYVVIFQVELGVGRIRKNEEFQVFISQYPENMYKFRTKVAGYLLAFVHPAIPDPRLMASGLPLQRSPEGPRHLHRIPRLSEAPWEVP